MDTIGIKNDGGGELHWNAHVAHAGTSRWVRIQPDSGIAGDGKPLRVFFLPDSVDPAVNDTILRDTVIVASSTTGAAFQTPLQFTIHRCRDIPISNADSRSDVLNSSDCGAPHATGGQYAQLYSFQRTANDSTSIILTPGFNGIVALDTAPFTPAVAPLATASACNGNAAVQCIYYFKFPRTAKYYIEVTSPTRGDSGSYTLRVLGPAGRVPNAPDSISQRRTTDSSAFAAGDTVRTTTVLFRAVVSDSDVVDTLHLEAEAQDVNTAFTGAPTAVGQPVLSDQPAWVSQPVASGKSYHWCVKVVDQTGRASACLPFGGNTDSPLPAATDFVVKVGNDPNPPPAVSLKQLQSDGSTVIPTGQVANGTTVVFQGDVSDPDAGNTVELQVEVQPVDSPFTNMATSFSGLVANPSTGVQVSVNAPRLVDAKSYHWQARTVDNTGLPSPWVSFGGNADSPLPADTDFTVQVLPTKLVITVPPAVDTSGRPMHPNVQVTAQDQNNNPVSSFTGAVTMAITSGTGTPGATLFGSNPANAVNGVATFSDLSINKAGSGYKLQASAVIGGNTITSAAAPGAGFTVFPGAGAQLAFTVQPATTTAGQTMPAVVVAVQDTAGNTVAGFSGNVTLQITPGTGKAGATLNGTTTVAVAPNGTATFSTLSIDSAGIGYTLKATSAGLTSATSTAFTINPGPATALGFTVQPLDAASGAFISPPVQVTAFDVKGNVATGFTGNVTMVIATGTGKPGASLSGTKIKAAAAGVATFSDLSIDSAGTGYELTATATGPSSATSNSFMISASSISPTNSTVTVSTGTITASSGSSATTITVTARDGSGNPVSGATVVFAASPTTGNILTPPSATTNGSGIATATLSSTKAEVKTVSATINGVHINQTQMVTVSPAPLVGWAWTNQPTNTTAGTVINGGSGFVVVTGQDQFQNTVTSFNSNVSM
ncbi:MAG TPA: invasin domain 3-containing protein, partial [Gemmatimonadales bacterium]|nr:invasin domain 3-containing protein [Gemmatimonadales bacterium]